MVLSPDGRSLVFSAVHDGRQQLYRAPAERARGDADWWQRGRSQSLLFARRAMDRVLGRRSRWPWFPRQLGEDGVSTGWAHGKNLAMRPLIVGASWGSDGTIVFGQRAGGLFRVSAAGGNAEPLTTLDATQGESSHRLPFVLPGSQAVLFTVTYAQSQQWDATDIAVQSLATGERKVLIKGGADARYVPTWSPCVHADGHLDGGPVQP